MMGEGQLMLQRLLEIRGFLVYVVQTYRWINPYIKGLHLTIDAWCPGKDEYGFKLQEKELQDALFKAATARGIPCRREDEMTEEGIQPLEQQEAPQFVTAVPRLQQDIEQF